MDIAVITHANDVLFREIAGERFASNYLLGPIVREMANAMGHDITVYRGLPERPQPADLAILHVDLTRVPDEYLALGATFPRCANLRAADISKRVVSDALLGESEIWDGPVLVKSNLNFAGRPEGRQGGGAAPFDYRIYDSREAVPEPIRRDPGLVVEKFLPERDGEFYVTRFYLFAGEAEHCGRVHARDPIVKGETALGFEFCDIPESLRQRRRAMGFDFGKFDFVMHGGEPVLIDANKTPATMPVTEQSKWPRTYAEALLALAP